MCLARCNNKILRLILLQQKPLLQHNPSHTPSHALIEDCQDRAFPAIQV
jgi:hypothetical protein